MHFIFEPEEKKLTEDFHKIRRKYRETLERRNLPRMWCSTHYQYFGLDEYTKASGIKVSQNGNEIDAIKFTLNFTKTFIRQMAIIAIGERPAFVGHGLNTDVSSQGQAALTTKLIEYCTQQVGYNQLVHQRAETAILYGEGGILFGFDPSSGSPLPEEETLEQGEMSGMITAQLIYPWQITRDPVLKASKWIAVERLVDRNELLELYPDKEREIKSAPKVSSECRELLGWDEGSASEDHLSIYDVYHVATTTNPRGRHVRIVGDSVLEIRDNPTGHLLPYSGVQIRTYTGTSIGHPEAADAQALQALADQLVSASMSNILRYKDQPLYVDASVESAVEHQGVISLPSGTKPPTTANYQQLPEAVKYMLSYMKDSARSNLGINEVVTGEAGLDKMSGVAIATASQQAVKQQFMFQVQADQAQNQDGNTILEILKASASRGFVAEIAGSGGTSASEYFSGEAIRSLRKVSVKRTSALLNTFAGMQDLWNTIKDSEPDVQRRLVECFQTNSLDPLFEGLSDKTRLIRAENERMLKGIPVRAVVSDDHEMHHGSHQAFLDDLRASKNPDSPQVLTAVQAISAHLLEHENFKLGVQSTPPQGGSESDPMGNTSMTPEPAEPAAPAKGLLR